MGTVIQSNLDTTHNWRQVQKVIRGLTYSHSFAEVKRYSMDEDIGNVVVLSTGTMEAYAIIGIIGEEPFKKMIECIWEPTFFLRRVSSDSKLSEILIGAFAWRDTDTKQSWEYWRAVYDKLRAEGL